LNRDSFGSCDAKFDFIEAEVAEKDIDGASPSQTISSSIVYPIKKLTEDVRKIIEGTSEFPQCLLLYVGEYDCNIEECVNARIPSARNKYMKTRVQNSTNGYTIYITGFHIESTPNPCKVCTFTFIFS
jgi:hypothetical protein